MIADIWFFSLVLLLREKGWDENMLKMPVFSLMKLVQCFEENLIFLFLKHFVTFVLQALLQQFQERR